ncbi:MAG: gamma-glutamyltransferase family protein [Chloroflexi bacterium]|nr:gamma-glutamyltransferase family protein [Chloroflexota bacterium]
MADVMATERPLVPMALARGRTAAVVAPHHLATAAGLSILRAGGTAVDAAIATNAVLAVVMPNGCGIGGDAFWLIWEEASATMSALNGSGRAPAAADAAAWRRAGATALPMRGPLTITTPGAVRSWARAQARHGRLSRATILSPAIDLAARGFPAWDGYIAAVERSAEIFRTSPALPDHGSAWASVHRPAGRPWRPGELVRQPALARTLERLALAGFDDLYDGDLAGRQASGLAAAGSPITAADLAAQDATWEAPISTSYRGGTVTTHPPNSSGLVALEILAILDRFDPPTRSAFGPAGVTDAAWLHTGIEAAKLAMADRDAFLADPAVVDIPVEHLLDPGRIAELAGRIDPGHAAAPRPSVHPRGGGTVYLATVDADGSAVSLIESNYRGFGSGVLDPATGIHYHDRGSYFTLAEGHPNELAPGKRPLHTLLPAMLVRAGRPWVVLGSMGGDTQPQILAQVVSALVDGGVDVATAIAAPRAFVEAAEHFAPPIAVRLESRFAPSIAAALTARGHPVTEVAAFDDQLGHCHAIELVDGGPATADGSVAAATDPRSAGAPAVC